MPRRLLSERSASAGSLAAPPRLPPPAAFPFAFAADIAGHREARPRPPPRFACAQSFAAFGAGVEWSGVERRWVGSRKKLDTYSQPI
jgi:hypothetical protein